MKLKILVKLGELILGEAYSEDEPRADMFLPLWLLAFAIIMLVAGVAVGIYAAVELSVGAVVGAVVCLGLGIMALLCWKNQSIVVLSDESFEYSTFLGNKKEYRFQDITDLKQNNDSMTLFVGNEKVHIESCALLTDRLIELINAQLEKLQGEQ